MMNSNAQSPIKSPNKPPIKNKAETQQTFQSSSHDKPLTDWIREELAILKIQRCYRSYRYYHQFKRYYKLYGLYNLNRDGVGLTLKKNPMGTLTSRQAINLAQKNAFDSILQQQSNASQKFLFWRGMIDLKRQYPMLNTDNLLKTILHCNGDIQQTSHFLTNSDNLFQFKRAENLPTHLRQLFLPTLTFDEYFSSPSNMNNAINENIGKHLQHILYNHKLLTLHFQLIQSMQLSNNLLNNSTNNNNKDNTLLSRKRNLDMIKSLRKQQRESQRQELLTHFVYIMERNYFSGSYNTNNNNNNTNNNSHAGRNTATSTMSPLNNTWMNQSTIHTSSSIGSSRPSSASKPMLSSRNPTNTTMTPSSASKKTKTKK